jgi:plasmid stabilization system protein ParE
MKFSVTILPEAEDVILRTAKWWATNRSSAQAVRWFTGIYDAFETLEEHPERCPLARECNLFPIELRELHFGIGSRSTHRVIFTIRPDMVVILTIRHTAQGDLEPEDLGFPSQ